MMAKQQVKYPHPDYTILEISNYTKDLYLPYNLK